MQRLGVLVFAVLVLGGIGWAWSDYSDRVDAATDRRTSAVTAERQAQTRVAFVGDSYTFGAGVVASEAFPALLSEERGWTYANLAEGGTGYIVRGDQDPEQALAGCGKEYCPSYPEVIQEAKRYDPQIVIVSGGRNNANDPAEDQEKAIRAFFKDLREALPDAEIYATTPLTDDAEATDALVAMAGFVQASVEDVDGTYLEIGQPLEGEPQFVLDDGVHPNAKGHQAIADAVMAAMETAGLPEQ